jgi:uracil-DNA glycosylase family 4
MIKVMVIAESEHYCHDAMNFPTNKFLQQGSGRGRRILVVGESPAPNGWRKSGKAFYTIENKLLPSGRNLNELLKSFGLRIEDCAFTELIKCYVGNDRKLLKSCGEKCWPIFERQLAAYQFELLIILGKATLDIINRQLKADFQIGNISKIQMNGREYLLFPIYHPSPINPNNRRNNLLIFSNRSDELHGILSKIASH